MQVPTDVTTTSSALPQGQVPRVQQAQPTSNDHCPSCGEFVGAAAALAGTTIMGAVTGAGGGAMMGLLVKGGDLLADRMFGDSGVNIPMREAVIGGAAIMSVIMGATSCLNACFAAPRARTMRSRYRTSRWHWAPRLLVSWLFILIERRTIDVNLVLLFKLGVALLGRST